MGWYEDKLLPHAIDLACGIRPAQKQRAKIVPAAAGEVLEVGFGSGLNLPFYDARKVDRIWALEPSQGMRRLAEARVSATAIDVQFIDLPGEEIPLESASVDTVVVTYTLCTIPEVHAALEGMRRVLRPAGTLLFCEHGRAPDSGVARWQNRLNPLWAKIGGGCNMNRYIPDLLGSAGFTIVDDNRMYIPGPRILAYNYWGTARIS